MAPKKIVIKTDIHCDKCKTEVLTSMTELSGIDQVSVDAEKQTLTVVGEVDPVSIVEKVRKLGKFADIISVGPNKPPIKPIPCPLPLPPHYHDHLLVPVNYDETPQCTIL